MRTERGFTLFELVVVIVLGGLIAAAMATFLRPALDAHLASHDRAALTGLADTALRRVAVDVRAAVPNSVRVPDAACMELVPAVSGGRLRLGPDTVADDAPDCTASATCAAPLDTTRAIAAVDLLTTPSTPPAVGDWLVAGNRSPAEVHGGSNRVRITSVTTPDAAFGVMRLGFASQAFPPGSDSGRFSIVPADQQAVFYICEGADGTLDAQGDGRGRLVRRAGYGFQAAYPATCPAAGTGQILATGVTACRFVHDPHHGATQQNGFVLMQVELARRGERVALTVGVHVPNVP